MALMNGGRLCASSVMPSRSRCRSCRLERNHFALSPDCWRSAMIASVAATISSHTGRRDQQVLERATHAHVHLAQIGIDRTDVAPRVGIHIDVGVGNVKKPRLGVVRTRGKNRRAHQSQGAALAACPPRAPGLVGGTVSYAEHALVEGAPDQPAGNCHRGDARALEHCSSCDCHLPPPLPSTITRWHSTRATDRSCLMKMTAFSLLEVPWAGVLRS